MPNETYKFTHRNLIKLMEYSLNQDGITTSLGDEGVASISFEEIKDNMGSTEYIVKIQRN